MIDLQKEALQWKDDGKQLVLMGDWNMDPAALDAAGWVEENVRTAA